MGCATRSRVFARLLRSAAASVLVLAATQAAAVVPRPFVPLSVKAEGSAVRVNLGGRSYRFDVGPLPTEIRSQGGSVLADRPRFRVAAGAGLQEIVWTAPTVLSATPEAVRLRFVGSTSGLGVTAETLVEYDGMMDVTLMLTAHRALQLGQVSYQLDLARGIAEFYSHHLPWERSIDNVLKDQLLTSAGAMPSRLAFDFVPTLALGNRHSGIEWWSETNAHWRPRAGTPSMEVLRDNAGVHLHVTPIRTAHALAQGEAWTDRFTLFTFPARPPRPRWRSVRFLPYSSVWRLDRTIGSRFVYMATQGTFHPRHDGLPSSMDDAFQRKLRSDLQREGVDYMPYGMLMIAPLMHPRTMGNFEIWSAGLRWWRIYAGASNPVLERNHPELGIGDPYTYPACAGRTDYFDWILAENLQAVRTEGIDALYFDQGLITRMCAASPRLAGTTGRQIFEYRNVRRFYKRLYEALAAEAPDTLVVMHTNGTPKAIGAFVDYHVSGEALNGVFGNGYPPAVYFSTPSVYTPDYFSLPPGYLDAQLFPPVGGVSSLAPQVRWSTDPSRPTRSRWFQRTLHGVTLSNDVHAPIWASDVDAAIEIHQALDRFGDIGNATVSRWWSNLQLIQRPAGMRATAWLRGGRALVVLVNPGTTSLSGRVVLDLDRLGAPRATRYRDLEDAEAAGSALVNRGFDVSVQAKGLRIFAVE
jgi:hypothetical protein